jgi:hypothetical protein
MAAFSNPQMLWGALLALIPLLLFILERRRAAAVEWPAMRFFLRDARRRVRWMRLHELALLLLRAGVLTGAAVALARPVTMAPEAHRAAVAGKRASVIIVDNTLSMEWRSSGGAESSLWERARSLALALVDEHRPGDVIAVLPLAASAAELAAVAGAGPRDARGALQALRSSGGSVRVSGALDRAADLLAGADAAAPSVTIITDLQAKVWDLEDRARWSFALERLRALRPAPPIRLAPLRRPGENPANRAAASLELEGIAAAGRPLEAVGVIVQHGDGGVRELDIELSIDGLPAARRKASLAPGAPFLLRFPCRFQEAGPHRIELRLEGDALAADDRAFLAVDVVDRIPALIIEGDGGSGRLGGDGDLVDLALAPRAGEETVPDAVFAPEIVSWSRLAELGALEAFVDPARERHGAGFIVLANVPRVDPAQAEHLERFIRRGGGVLIFGGGRLDAAFWNERFFRDGDGILPARLKGWRSASGAPLKAAALRLEHPAFAPFPAEARQDFDALEVRSWLECEVPADGAPPFAELAGGAPLALEKAAGKGKVILVTVPARLEASNLPGLPIFVPWLHGMAHYLASGGAAARALVAGEELELDIEASPGAAAPRVSLELPDGSLKALRAERRGDGLAVRERARVPGFHVVRVRDEGADADRREHAFAVNAPRDESELRALSEKDLERIEKVYGLEIAAAPESVLLAPAAEARREWRGAVAAMVLAMALLEAALAGWAGRS